MTIMGESLHPQEPPRGVGRSAGVIYNKALGEELRRLRLSRGWTRHRMCRLTTVLPQTLATYELGTRTISVHRLVEVCGALGVYPHDVLAAIDARLLAGTGPASAPPADADAGPDLIEVDLNQLAHARRPIFGPARAWAASRLAARQATGIHSSARVSLSREALTHLAQLCGTSRAELVTALRDFGPNGPRPGPGHREDAA